MAGNLDTILSSLEQLQKTYALAHQPGHDNLFSWMGVDFFVDQIRHWILPAAALQGEWQESENGQIFATNKALLFMSSPNSRDLPVTYFQRILADILQEQEHTKLIGHRLGYFLTLMVAEVSYNPLTLTTTLIAVSKAIEQKQTNENIFDLVPKLLIDAAMADLSEEELQAYKQANMAQQIALMQEVRPNIVAEMETLLQNNSMETAIDVIRSRMLSSLQTRIFIG